MDQQGNRVRSFMLLAFCISWLLWLPEVLQSRDISIPGYLRALSMAGSFGPTIAALTLVYRDGGAVGVRRFVSRGTRLPVGRFALLIGAALWPVMAAVALFISSGASLATLRQALPAGLPSFALLTVQIFLLGGPLGEEYGWRGYALPLLLSKRTPLTASLLLGALHAIWHLPLALMTGTVQSAIPYWQFALITVVSAVPYTWVNLRTRGSVAAALVMHTAANLAAALFPYWHTQAGRTVGFALLGVASALMIARGINDGQQGQSDASQ